MKKSARKTRQRQITRREFVGGAVAAAGVITGAPAILRGRNLNDKLNIAFIACGGRAQDEPQRAHDHAPGDPSRAPARRRRIRTRTSSSSAT